MSGVERLIAWTRGEGGLMAGAVPDDLRAPAASAEALTARSDRPAGAHADDVELAVEAVLEGYRLHYAQAAVLVGAEPDLALLTGDRLYALGLARLAEHGDLGAIAALADVISECAAAHAAGDAGGAARAWEHGARAIRPRP